jgi:hypothetical protein
VILYLYAGRNAPDVTSGMRAFKMSSMHRRLTSKTERRIPPTFSARTR